jgi:hypothetical protein
MRRLWIPTLGGVTIGLLLWQAPALTRESSSRPGTRGQRDALFGVVRDVEDDEPIAAATILAEQVGGDRHSVLSDRDGRYALKDVPAGDYVITAFAPEFATEVFGDTIRVDGLTPRRVDFRLERRKSGGLYGWVHFTEDSLPVANVQVRLVSDSAWESVSTTTDNDGAYLFHAVPSGSYTLLVSGAGWGAVPWNKSVVVSPDTLLGSFDFYLPKSGHIGEVTGSVGCGGIAQSGAEVFALTNEPLCELILATSGVDGHYRLGTNLTDYVYVWARHGDYSLQWRGNGVRWDPTQRVYVPHSHVDFQLVPRATGPWGISGKITGPNGPLCLGFVSATDTNGNTVDVSPIWPNGRYALGHLPSGGYSLRFVVPGKLAMEIGYVRIAQASQNSIDYDIGQMAIVLDQ